MDVTISTGNASVDDCIGTLNITLTTDGYSHADMAGTGTCTSTAWNHSTVHRWVAFQNSGHNVYLWRFDHTCECSNETFYGNIVNGNLVFDVVQRPIIQLTWQTSIPISWCCWGQVWQPINRVLREDAQTVTYPFFLCSFVMINSSRVYSFSFGVFMGEIASSFLSSLYFRLT